MKQLITTTGLWSLVLLCVWGCDSERVITREELPDAALTYIQTHFADYELLQAVKDRDAMSVGYEIILEGGFRLDFDRQGEIQGIDGAAPLPDSAVPSSIGQYVRANFPGQQIVQWKRDGRKDDVELDNGVELEFDKDGKFLRMDR